jgi:hypothetical protein
MISLNCRGSVHPVCYIALYFLVFVEGHDHYVSFLIVNFFLLCSRNPKDMVLL